MDLSNKAILLPQSAEVETEALQTKEVDGSSFKNVEIAIETLLRNEDIKMSEGEMNG